MRGSLQELYTISNRPYSSRARRVKALATGKATPKKDLNPVAPRQLSDKLREENDATKLALKKASRPVVPKTDIPTPKAVSASYKDTAVDPKGPAQRYGRQVDVTASLKLLTN